MPSIEAVPANLAMVLLSSFTYGVFFVLAIVSIYFLRSRHRENSKTLCRVGPPSLTRRPRLFTPVFAATLALLVTVTAVS